MRRDERRETREEKKRDILGFFSLSVTPAKRHRIRRLRIFHDAEFDSAFGARVLLYWIESRWALTNVSIIHKGKHIGKRRVYTETMGVLFLVISLMTELFWRNPGGNRMG